MWNILLCATQSLDHKGSILGPLCAKCHVREAYRRDYDRIKQPKHGPAKSLKIYMSSSTDPYLPQEKAVPDMVASG